MKRALFLIVAVACLGGTVVAREKVQARHVYKTIGDRELAIHLHFPPGWKASDKRPAIVFFFGGGWRNGHVRAFLPQAEYFASRGLVTARADYRVQSRDGVAPDACVTDARSAVRWVKQHASRLGVDPGKLITSGGSAGGHLAACAMIRDCVESDDDDLSVSTVPAAMLLFNPALDMSARLLVNRLGGDRAIARMISPTHQLARGDPPAILFYGTEDRRLVQGEEYRARAEALGVRAEMFLAKGQGHSFFNRSPWRERTMAAADRFLASLGLTEGEPTIEESRPPRRGQRRERNVPAPDHINVKYGDHEAQALDLWLADSDVTTPLVVYYHGGGFRGGDKRSVNPALLRGLLGRGVSFAAVNYRLSGVAPFPAQMHDCARALQFLRHHAATYNLDPARVGATGGSAGAGISLWLAFHDDLADAASEDPVARQSTRISAAVVFGAQCSYDPRFIMKLFGTDKVDSALIPFFGMSGPGDVDDPKFHPLFVEASPINHATADDVPVLLYYPQPNAPVPPNSDGRIHIHHPKFGFALKEKLDGLGVECVLLLREDHPHGVPVDKYLEFFHARLAVN